MHTPRGQVTKTDRPHWSKTSCKTHIYWQRGLDAFLNITTVPWPLGGYLNHRDQVLWMETNTTCGTTAFHCTVLSHLPL